MALKISNYANNFIHHQVVFLNQKKLVNFVADRTAQYKYILYKMNLSWNEYTVIVYAAQSHHPE